MERPDIKVIEDSIVYYNDRTLMQTICRLIEYIRWLEINQPIVDDCYCRYGKHWDECPMCGKDLSKFKIRESKKEKFLRCIRKPAPQGGSNGKFLLKEISFTI